MNAIDRLIEADRKTPKRIGVFGDSMTDIYAHGRMEIGQEDTPKFIEERLVCCPGGASNAARQLYQWNSKAVMLGPETEYGIKKTRFVVNGKTVFRHDDDGCLYGENDLERHRELALQELEEHPCDGILISDYDKYFLTPHFIRQIIDYANERGIPCVADAKREPKLYRGAIIKCNADYNRKYDKWWEKRDMPAVLTLGHSQCVVLNEEYDNSKLCGQTKPVECVSHVGAGDCFAAHLTLALAHDFSLEDAATIAHSAGRVYVQFAHNRPPWPHEIRRDIDPCQGKIIQFLGLTALRESIPGKIVFANGCFDLFGPHHLHLLNEAKKHGDALVVGVNSDESVRHLKGMGRPVIPHEQRAMLIAGLEAVDWVVVFDEDTPAKVMEQLKPDIRVVADLGRNFDGDQFAKEVVKIAPLEGWSTTSTVTKIMRMPS